MHDKARRFLRHHLALALAMCVVSLIFATCATQLCCLCQVLTADKPIPLPTPASPEHSAISLASLGSLFGVLASLTNVQPRKAKLPLRLVGSFVSANLKGSAALIQIGGKPARRMVGGQKMVRDVM